MYIIRNEVNEVKNALTNNIGPDSAVSSKYQFISTMEYLKPFLSQGWQIDTVMQGKNIYSKHAVKLKHPTLFKNALDGCSPNLLILNSHDRSCKFTVSAGFIRSYCFNGCVWGEDIKDLTFKHIGKNIESKIENSYFKITAHLEEMFQKLEKLQKIETTLDLKSNLVANIARSLFESDTGKYKKEVLQLRSPHRLFTTRRIEDRSNDFFTTYQKVQENIVRNGALKVILKETNKETNEVKIVNRSLRASESRLKSIEVNKVITREALKLVA